MKFLVKTTEVWRIDSEAEAAAFIEENKHSSSYAITKYDCTHKEKKSKGEIIDEYYLVTLVKAFNDEKEPDTDVSIIYDI